MFHPWLTFSLTENLVYLLFSLEGFVQLVKWFVKVGECIYQGQLCMLRILKVLYDFRFFMFGWCILSDVVVVYIVIHFKTIQFLECWKGNLWQQQESQAAVCT